MKRLLLLLVLFLSAGLVVGCSSDPTTQAQTTNVTTETPTNEVDTGIPTSSLPRYTIEWEVDGSIVETDEHVEKGTMPEYNGDTPVKPQTDQYEYTFSGWTPEVSEVTASQTYQAVFTESLREYEIQFISNEGSNVDGGTYTYGTELALPSEPVREGYKFEAWYLDSDFNDLATWPYVVKGDQMFYAKWKEMVPFAGYLSLLLNNYTFDPYNFIPATMMPMSNLYDEADLTGLDYSTFISNDSIPYGGYGEQWMMVLDNIGQTEVFFDVIGVVDSISSLSVSAYEAYLDTNPSDTASYEFESGIYNVSISIEDNTINYIIDYTADIPMFGSQTVQIALSMNYVTGNKEGRIQIGDANALRYVVTDDAYEFAIKYAGVRRAYFEISKNTDGSVEGQIFEYLGLDEVFTSGSAAQFFIDDDYVSVIGNKSSSMMGWEGTINELYDVETSQLLGYEIRETLSSVTYNTLWFNLGDTSGITNIKVNEAPVEESNPYLVYINDNEDVFATKTYGGFGLKMLSRRFDIELRSQYFYYLEDDVLYQVETLVPMIFIQEEMLDDLEDDVNEENPNLNFTLNVPDSIQNIIMDDYDNLIDDFIASKDIYTVQLILDYIGDPYTH